MAHLNGNGQRRKHTEDHGKSCWEIRCPDGRVVETMAASEGKARSQAMHRYRLRLGLKPYAFVDKEGFQVVGRPH